MSNPGSTPERLDHVALKTMVSASNNVLGGDFNATHEPNNIKCGFSGKALFMPSHDQFQKNNRP